MDIYPRTHGLCDSDLIKIVEKNMKVESGHVLCCARSSYHDSQSNANIVRTSMTFILIQVTCDFDVHVNRTT